MTRAPTPPTVSVIVPAYGVAHLLGDALRSLQAQSLADWEAIVIDDGAPDDVAGAVQPFADDPRIRLIQSDNGGLPTARNRAIGHARAPLIALLDGDDVVEPGYLAAMVRAIEADPAIGLVCCDATYFGDSRVGERFSDHVPQEGPVTLDRVLSRQFNIFITVLFRAEAWREVGGFDASLRSAEDIDLWLRILGAGWRAAYVAEPLAKYRRRSGSMSSDTARLLRAEDQVYAAAEARLAGRPEAATASAMRAEIARALARAEGEGLILSGNARTGLVRLREGQMDAVSWRWRWLMPVMSALPPLAPPLFRLRAWLNR